MSVCESLAKYLLSPSGTRKCCTEPSKDAVDILTNAAVVTHSSSNMSGETPETAIIFSKRHVNRC